MIHRDIKPQNILFDQDDTPKICDFGVSHVLPDPSSDAITSTEGTFHFLSPEACDPDIDVLSGKAVDAWALGVTIYCMLFSKAPFYGDTEFHLMEAIRTTPLEIPKEPAYSEGLINLLAGLL